MEAVRAVSAEITKSPELRSLLQLIVRHAAEILAADMCAIYLWDRRDGALVPEASQGFDNILTRLFPGQGVVGRVAERRTGLIVNDYRTSPLALPHVLAGSAIAVLIAEPLVSREELVGVIVAARAGAARPYVEEDREPLSIFAAHAAIAIENARLFQAARRERREAEILAGLAQKVNASLNPEIVLQAVAEGARELCGCDFAEIAVRGPRGDAMSLTCVAGRPLADHPPLTIEPGKGMGGKILETGLPFRTANYAEDARLSKEHLARIQHLGVVAEMGVPIRIDGQIEGVIYVDNCSDRPFSDRDESTLIRLAEQAAVAIRNAHLHTAAVRRSDELTALLRAANSLKGGPELSTILARILAEAARISGSAHVKILLVDEEANVLYPGAIEGTAMSHGQTMPIGSSLSGLVAARGEVVYSPDCREDPRNLFREGDRALGIVSYLGLPIRIRDRVAGVLAFNTTAPRSYTPDEIAYLSAFADQAAQAIESASLLHQEQRRRQQLEAIGTVTQEITWELDLPTLLRLISRRSLDLLGGSSGAIWLWDQVAQQLRPAAWHGLGSWVETQTRALGEGIPGLVAESRTGRIVNDYQKFPLAHPAMKERADITAVVAEPLLHHDRLIGVITVNRGSGVERRFEEEDRQTLSLLAGQAATAIENARLYAELKASYDELQQAQSELVRTEKLRGLGQMAAGMAHDLNNMLAAVLGQTELLKLRVTDTTILEALGTLETAAMDGAQVVRRLQDFARQRTSSPLAPCDLARITREAVELTRPRWEDEAQRKGVPIRVELRFPDDLPRILGHPPELREALTNLILNAVDAMPQGGTLTLAGRLPSATGEEQGSRDAGSVAPQLLRRSASPQSVELAVTDTGVGIPPEMQARIFDPFFTTKGLNGSGLGLSVVYGIMERHRGRIDVKSVPGQGSTFVLQFQPALAVPAPSLSRSPAMSRSRRLLIIEDEATVRETLANLLRAVGHTVFEAEGGQAGLDLLARESVDCVLSDLGMPEMTGWEVARRVAAGFPGLPVILLTGWGETIDADRPDGTTVARILGKPVEFQELLRTLDDVAGGGR